MDGLLVLYMMRGRWGILRIEVSGSRIPVAFFFLFLLSFSLLGSSRWMDWADGFEQQAVIPQLVPRIRILEIHLLRGAYLAVVS